MRHYQDELQTIKDNAQEALEHMDKAREALERATTETGYEFDVKIMQEFMPGNIPKNLYDRLQEIAEGEKDDIIEGELKMNE